MTETRQITNFLRALALIFLGFGMLFLSSPAKADDNLYVIRGISVDETASTAAAARTKAVEVGQRRAFGTLLRHLVLKAYHSNLPNLSDDEITPLVSSFQVANERSSAQRYLADLTFEFKRDAVRGLLRRNALPFSESVGKPLLILPVYETDERSYLWEEPNPWRTVWVNIVGYGARPQEPVEMRDDWAQTFLQPVLVPSGDLEDIKMINVDQALNLEKDALEKIREAYGAGGVVVVAARLRTDTDGKLVLDITRERATDTEPTVVESYRGAGEAESDPQKLMQGAIFDLLGKMQEDWKRKTVLDFSTETTLAVTTKVSSLKNWLGIQDKVGNLAAVSETRVKDLSVGEAFWYITFIGSIDKLTTSLAQKDLTLVQHDGYWTLDPATAGAEQ
ncbi:MAG: DUF2066 domain-containing protein [Alphaproteobacteria bacterium]|nr:MAG: DUF2066 domain-containing protein [Alphaproteobacteria bacterium]